MKCKKIPLIIILTSFSLFSCSETATDSFDEITLTEDQIEMKSKMKQATLILVDLVKDKNVVQELKIATNFALENGRDEDVTFSELLYDNAEYKKHFKSTESAVIGSFKKHFLSALKSKAKVNGSTIDPDLEEYLVKNNLKIYWPYSENWIGDDASDIPTISYHPLDNEDTNEGFRPVTAKANRSNFETIVMNDEYSYNNPSLLIVPCEEEFQVYKANVNEAISCGGGGGGTGDPDLDDGNDETAPGEFDKNHLILHSTRLSKQYDGLFAGGSEMRWQISDGHKRYDTDTNPTLSVGYVPKNFSRKDIRKKRWKSINVRLDDDWSKYELGKELYIWEGDEGDKKIDVNLGVKIALDSNGSAINFGVTAKADKSRDDIYKVVMDRQVFYYENRTNAFNRGQRDGFAVREVNDLKWVFSESGINFNDN